MKKYLGSLVAIILAISFAAFTLPKQASVSDTVYDWQVFDASGNPTSTYILDKTKANMQIAYPNCNANTTTCFRAWNLGHTQSTNVYLKKQ